MRTGIIDAEINGMWQVAHDSGELSSAVTSYDITGLEGNTDIEYQLIVRGIANGITDFRMRFNNDTGSNYGYQTIKGANSTASASRGSTTTIVLTWDTISDDSVIFNSSHIFAKSGKERTVLTHGADDISSTTVTQIFKSASSWNNTADELTQINLFASSGGFNIGTRFILLKKVHNDAMKTGVLTPNKIEGAWERIYSNTLTSAATTISITGLEGNADVLYKVLFRFVANGNLSTLLRLGGSSLDTGSNYGTQRLTGYLSTVAANRGSGTNIGLDYDTVASGNLSMCEMLIYAKSGFERPILINNTGDIGGTTVTIVGVAGSVWSDTSDELVQMSFYAGANAIGIGSTIEVYKLNL